MRWTLAILMLVGCMLVAPVAAADPKAPPKPWCAPEVLELSDHVCWVDGGAAENGKRTLVVYLHGALAQRPGFAWMQQRAMAEHAKRHAFTVLMPTGPSDGVGFVWPSAPTDVKDKEPAILAGIARGRAELERRAGRPFDETFVIGFSSGAYYASSLALRGAIDADGFVILAGGGGWVARGERAGDDEKEKKRAPIFVGVSAADPLSADHARGLAGVLRATGWPSRIEERQTGHGVDWIFLAHALGWLRGGGAGERASRARSPVEG